MLPNSSLVSRTIKKITSRNKMGTLKELYGIENRVFVMTKIPEEHVAEIILMNPLRDSINEYLGDLPDDADLIHLALDYNENNTFNSDFHRYYESKYAQILKELGIDIRKELQQATCEQSDEQAR